MGPRISTSSVHTSSPGGSPEDILLRVRQADAMMAHVRDFEAPGGHLDLPDRDALCDPGGLQCLRHGSGAAPPETLYDGRYLRRADGTASTWIRIGTGPRSQDAQPSHNGLEIRYFTWRDDSGPFIPGGPRPGDLLRQRDDVAQRFRPEHAPAHGRGPGGARPANETMCCSTPPSGNYDHFPVVVDFSMGSTR